MGLISFKAAFRIAKRNLGIPSNVNTPKPQIICPSDGSEVLVVWEFEDGKFIVMHPKDRNWRGLHLHTADDSLGSPLERNTRYNQHSGHIPEDKEGIDKKSMKSSKCGSWLWEKDDPCKG